jgi:hypothetical protein
MATKGGKRHKNWRKEIKPVNRRDAKGRREESPKRRKMGTLGDKIIEGKIIVTEISRACFRVG